MPRTETRLSNDEKKDWQRFCRDHSTTEADMLRQMINRVSSGKESKEIPEPGCDEKKTEKVTIRMTGENKNLLIEKSRQEGYSNRTAYVTSLVLAALRRQPVLSLEEISALRESNRQIAAIGRNLNQLVRMLYSDDFRALNRLTRVEVKMLAQQVEEHKKNVANLLEKNMNRWELG